MSDKVKLPREVVEALDHHKYQGLHNVMEQVINFHSYEVSTEQLVTIRKYFKVDWTILAAAIVNGYEVEETPEDKVRALYEDYQKEKMWTACTHIETVLDLLGIKIEGVNA